MLYICTQQTTTKMETKKRNTFANKMNVIAKYGYIKEIKDANEAYSLYSDMGEDFAKEYKVNFLQETKGGRSLYVYFSFCGKCLVSQYNAKGLDGFKNFVNDVAYIQAHLVPMGLD